jgi:energy-coupling factor transport system permease protein
MVDLLAAAITVALRRGDEMGDAIAARGGTGQISAVPSGPKTRDWVTFAVVLAISAVALALELTVLGTSAAS